VQRALRGAMPDTHIVWGPSLSPADSTFKDGCRQGLHGDLCGGGTGEDRLMIAPDPPGKASQTTVWGTRDLQPTDLLVQLLVTRMGVGDGCDGVGVPGEALGEEWVL